MLDCFSWYDSNHCSGVFSQVTLGSCAELSLKTIADFKSLVTSMPESLDFSLTPFPKEKLPKITRCGDRSLAEAAVADLEVSIVLVNVYGSISLDAYVIINNITADALGRLEKRLPVLRAMGRKS